jgi:hypothetical protein
MRLDRRDWVATSCVAAAAALYGLWFAGLALTGTAGTMFVAGTNLGLGIIASAFAVVPGFERLIRGSKLYLATASLVGLAALIAAVWTLVNVSEVTLAALIVATVALWAIATVPHLRLSRAVGNPTRHSRSRRPTISTRPRESDPSLVGPSGVVPRTTVEMPFPLISTRARLHPVPTYPRLRRRITVSLAI